MTDDQLTTLRKTYPRGHQNRPLPPDDQTGRPVPVRVGTREAATGLYQPYSLTRATLRGVKYYIVTWRPSGHTAAYVRKADSTQFLDAHYYAAGYRRITGNLPTWASE